MMSKERELLNRLVKSGVLGGYSFIKEVKELLAQPEQPEQEPVAWKVVDKTTGEFMFSRVKPTTRVYKYDEVINLYTAPPKREPLTVRAIAEGFIANRVAIHMDSYWAGVNDAEKAHGIGEDDE